MSDSTTIQVKEETADKLYDLRGRNSSYDDVIVELIESYTESEGMGENKVDELEKRLENLEAALDA